MTPLPSGLADPLHLPLPVSWKWLALVTAIFLGIVVAVLIRAWLKRRRSAARKPAPARVPAAPSGIVDEIEALRARYARARTFRLACHELSALLRGYFERSSGRRFSTLTAGEIRGALGDSRTARYFDFLAELQFGRRGPGRDGFDGACDLAIETVKDGA